MTSKAMKVEFFLSTPYDPTAALRPAVVKYNQVVLNRGAPVGVITQLLYVVSNTDRFIHPTSL